MSYEPEMLILAFSREDGKRLTDEDRAVSRGLAVLRQMDCIFVDLREAVKRRDRNALAEVHGTLFALANMYTETDVGESCREIAKRAGLVAVEEPMNKEIH